jgi:two-component system OmpR family response regulator
MKSRSILVVDNYPNVRKVLGEALQRASYEVHLAASGEEACEILRHVPIDAVLMDLRMPAMSGKTLFHVIMSQWPELRSSVAVMTGDPDASDHEPWLKLYELPVVMKPFTMTHMISLVEAITADPPREVNGEV